MSTKPILEILPFAFCCLVPVAAAGVVIWLRERAHGPQRRAMLAGRWDAMLDSASRNPSAKLCLVVRVHQYARTGTKAFVQWWGLPDDHNDTWFGGTRVTPGTYALVEGFYRYGPHRDEPHLFDVTRVVATVPASAYRAWTQREQQKADEPG